MKEQMKHYLEAVWPVLLQENQGQEKYALIDLMNISKENGDCFSMDELIQLVGGEPSKLVGLSF